MEFDLNNNNIMRNNENLFGYSLPTTATKISSSPSTISTIAGLHHISLAVRKFS